MLKEFIRRTPLYRPLHNFRSTVAINQWIKSGRPIPPPTYYKQKVIKDLANQFGVSIFIETGTFKGYMLQGLMPYFARLYSVEIYEPLYAKALQIFKKYPKVRLILGDSAEQVPLLLKELSEPALFWLDGHYSGEGTGTAQEHSPILAELNNIFSHRVKNHILLIDDARFFTGKDGYPTLEALEKFVKENSTYQHFSVNDDLILIHA